jgi:hypothetical protein
LSASAPEPRCSTTTVAEAFGVVRSWMWPAAVTPAPGPVTVIVTGAGEPSRVTTVASRNADQAAAATRSAGTPPWPRRASSRPTVSTVTPSPVDTTTCAVPSNAAPSCRPRSRRSGVNRQFSSRPPGTSNASTS